MEPSQVIIRPIVSEKSYVLAEVGKSFRNLSRVSVMPVGDAGVADVIGAAALLISETALPELVARAGGDG